MVNFNVEVQNVSAVFIQWESQAAVEFYEITVQALAASNILVQKITLCGNFRNWTIANLASGKEHQFTIKPIYEEGIPGYTVSSLETITESGEYQTLITPLYKQKFAIATLNRFSFGISTIAYSSQWSTTECKAATFC